ncbi:MAG: hypothetical protein JRM83_08460, partial [Nitrososphaerota archaeon]|nr:hypothetical protein [Nitrososphaerota archaeon]
MNGRKRKASTGTVTAPTMAPVKGRRADIPSRTPWRGICLLSLDLLMGEPTVLEVFIGKLDA